jgi:hypothetical protein
MLRRWWTWVVLGAVIVVGVFAGLDAFRSLDGEERASASTPTATTGDGRGGRPPPCARREISLAIETRRPDPNQPSLVGLYGGLPLPEYPVATAVLRDVGARSCYVEHFGFRLTIRDRTRRRLVSWWPPPPLWLGGNFSPGSEDTLSIPNEHGCLYPGPYVAVATFGPYSARRGNLSRSDIACRREP